LEAKILKAFSIRRRRTQRMKNQSRLKYYLKSPQKLLFYLLSKMEFLLQIVLRIVFSKNLSKIYNESLIVI